MTTDDNRVFAEVRDIQGPLLTFIHGGFCDHRDWAGQVGPLCTDFATIALDLPGHGKSPRPMPFTVESLAETVNDARRRAGSRPTILIAHGFGCSVAVEACHQDAADISGIVLIEGHPLAPQIRASLPPAEDKPAAALQAMQRMFETMFVPGSPPAFRRGVIEHVRHSDPAFVADLLGTLRRWQPLAAERLAELHVPVLGLQSMRLTNGLFAPLSLDDADWISFARMHVPSFDACLVASSGHFIAVDQPDIVNGHVRAFAQSVFNRVD